MTTFAKEVMQYMPYYGDVILIMFGRDTEGICKYLLVTVEQTLVWSILTQFTWIYCKSHNKS